MSNATVSLTKAFLYIRLALAALIVLTIIFLPLGLAVFGLVFIVQNGFDWFAVLGILVGGIVFLRLFAGTITMVQNLLENKGVVITKWNEVMDKRLSKLRK